MYRYDEFDAAFVAARVGQFRDQVGRRLAGELTEDQFRPHRLMNGLYLQLHSYMLRIAVPYGTLSSRQLRKLAEIARKYDRGYGHFTTRQNLQFNWPALKDVPDILAELASVEMHAIQTSGNCIRNVTADHYAGVAADELADPRPFAEILRQWSSLHPEFSFLPRKFKIAVNGAPNDRAVIQAHDIGLQIVQRRARANSASPSMSAAGSGARRSSATRCAISCRSAICSPIARRSCASTTSKAGATTSSRRASRSCCTKRGSRACARRSRPNFRTRAAARRSTCRLKRSSASPPISRRRRWRRAPRRTSGSSAGAARTRNSPSSSSRTSSPHKVPGYAIVTVSLKPIGGAPGDASADQMDAVADLAEDYSHDELRVSHEQNLILPYVALDDLTAVYDRLASVGLATPNAGLISDIIACPGLDYCALATARSIPIAQRISERFGDGARARAIGPLKIKISGCINACGHHHVGHIGILGLERAGEETYQITLGGSGDENASIGQIIGPGFSSETVVGAVETIVDTYMARRNGPQETFLDAYRRLGPAPFKDALYNRNAGADI